MWSHRLVTVLAAVVVTGLLLAGLTVQPIPGTEEARVPVSLGDHGLHASDLPLVGTWLVGLGLCAMLWRRD